MNEFVFALYVLMWPVLSLGVLAFIWHGVVKDFLDARRSGDDVV